MSKSEVKISQMGGLFKVRQAFACMLSCAQLCVTPRTIAHQAPLSMGFPRQECWSGVPFPPLGDLASPALSGRFLTTVLPAKAFGRKQKLPTCLFLASPPNLSSPGLSATRALTQGEGQPPAHGHASLWHDPKRTKEPHYGHQERDPNTERPPMWLVGLSVQYQSTQEECHQPHKPRSLNLSIREHWSGNQGEALTESSHCQSWKGDMCILRADSRCCRHRPTQHCKAIMLQLKINT